MFFWESFFKEINNPIKFNFSQKTNIDFISFENDLQENIQFNDVRIDHIRCNKKVNLDDKLSFMDTQFGVPVDLPKLITSKESPKYGEPPVAFYLNFKNIIFSKIEFLNCTFYIAPDFLGSKLNHQTIFSRCNFYDTRQKSIAKYRFLCSQMQHLGNEREASMFKSLDIEASHIAELKGDKILGTDTVEKCVSILYLYFSGYGQDLFQPLKCIFLTFLFFWIVFSFWYVGFTEFALSNSSNFAHYFKDSSFALDQIFAAFIQYLWNTLGPIGFFKDLPSIQITSPFAPALIFVHKLSASIMWFLWILQIRRRFKL